MGDLPLLTFAGLEEVLPDAVRMRTVDGAIGMLERNDIEERWQLDGHSDQALKDYFARHGEVVVVARQREDGSVQLQRRSQFLKDPWLKRVAGYKRGEVRLLAINDTNSQFYAYGEIERDIEGRCEKQSLRRLLRERRILPLLTPEGHPPLEPADVLAARLEDDRFWQLYYPTYELNPGDFVLACVSGFHYDPVSDSRCVLLDVLQFLERLDADKKLVFPWLGLQSSTESPQQALVSFPAESLPPMPASASVSFLLVDDDQERTLRPTAAFLRSDGYEVVECANADSATQAVERYLESTAERPFDIALIDIHLTPVTARKQYRGLHFANWLRQRMPRCAIILWSAEGLGSDSGGKPQAAGDLAVIDYLVKPVRAAQLRAILRQLPYRRPTKVADLFHSDAPDSTLASLVRRQRQLKTDDIRTILGRTGTELGAQKVVLFRMHRISRSVSIVAETGPNFPNYAAQARRLRYSPVRDVCEDEEEWYHVQVPTQWPDKHRNLLRLCGPSREYRACAASPVPAPPGDDNSYGLFAFAFEEDQFRPALGLDLDPSSPQAGPIIEAVVKNLMRENAAYAGQHLLEGSHLVTQVRQHPFLVLGMATSSLGHDLANCLTGADMLVSRLQAELRPGVTTTEKHTESLATLQSIASRAIAISDTFKKQAQAQREAKVRCDLVELILAAWKAVSFAAEQSHTTMFYFREPRVQLHCQRGVLERVLFNILLNAAQQIGLSLRGSGTIQVHHFLYNAEDGPSVAIRVYDNGPGIQGYRRHSIFHPGETSRQDGSGMGLAIAKQEIAKLGGKIELPRSVLLCGSCFQISLPAKVYAGLAKKEDHER